MKHGKRSAGRGEAPKRGFSGKPKRFGGSKEPRGRNERDGAPRRFDDAPGGGEKVFRGGGGDGFRKPFRKPRERDDAFNGDRPREPRGARFQKKFSGGKDRHGAGRPFGDRPSVRSDSEGSRTPPFKRDLKPDAERSFKTGREGRGRRAPLDSGHEHRAHDRSAYVRSEQPRDRHERRGGPEAPGKPGESGPLWIYGRHAALAAILNPNRRIKRILATESARDQLAETDMPAERRALIVEAAPFEIDRALHDGAVHQGLAVEVEALARARLRETCDPAGAMRPVVVLDQITDPHNIGAVFRSAAAFGARAVIVQDRRTPPLAGALAKAAAGAVESVPCIEVVNISRALEGLKELGYFCAGLAGEAGRPIADIPRSQPVALVLGAEGDGLRRLVGETCDDLFRIQLDPAMDSLNVSNAAAIALYEIGRSGT